MSSPPAEHPPAVSWKKTPFYGPKRPIPKTVIDFIQTWHRLHPQERTNHGRLSPPPFHYRIRTKNSWKVFDRNGREVSASMFHITRPMSYPVLVLYPVSGPACLVSSYFSFSTNQGTFLASWSDPHHGPDPDPYALRVSGPSKSDIQHDPGAWGKLETEHMLRQRRLQAMSESGSRVERASSKMTEGESEMLMLMSMLDQRRVERRNSDGPAARTPAAAASGVIQAPATAPVGATHRTTGTAARSMASPSDVSDSEETDTEITEYETSEVESSSEEDEEAERPQLKRHDEPPAKRRRTNYATHLLSPPATAKATDTPREVFFQLTWATVECVTNTSCFRPETGWTVKDLFQRVAEIVPANPLIRDQINWPCDWLVKRASCIQGDGKPVHIVVKLRAL